MYSRMERRRYTTKRGMAIGRELGMETRTKIRRRIGVRRDEQRK